jgi:hypothetical protein
MKSIVEPNVVESNLLVVASGKYSFERAKSSAVPAAAACRGLHVGPLRMGGGPAAMGRGESESAESAGPGRRGLPAAMRGRPRRAGTGPTSCPRARRLSHAARGAWPGPHPKLEVLGRGGHRVSRGGRVRLGVTMIMMMMPVAAC